MNSQVTGICFILFPICFTSALLINEGPHPATRGPQTNQPLFSIAPAPNLYQQEHTSQIPAPLEGADYDEHLDHYEMAATDASQAARIITRNHGKKPKRRFQQRFKPNTKDSYDRRHYYHRHPQAYNQKTIMNERPVTASLLSSPTPPVMIYRGPNRPLEPFYGRPPSTKIQFKRKVTPYEPRTQQQLSSYQIEPRIPGYRIGNDNGKMYLNGVHGVVGKNQGSMSAPNYDKPMGRSAAMYKADEPFPTGSDSNTTLQTSASTSFLSEYNSKSGVFADITRLKELQDQSLDKDYENGENIDDDKGQKHAQLDLSGKPNFDIHSGGIFSLEGRELQDSNETLANFATKLVEDVMASNITDTTTSEPSKLQPRTLNTGNRFDRYNNGEYEDYDYFQPNPVTPHTSRPNRQGRGKSGNRSNGSSRNSNRREDQYHRASGANYSPLPVSTKNTRNDNMDGRRINEDRFRVMDHYDGGFSAPRARQENGGTSGRVRPALQTPSFSGRSKSPPPMQFGEEYEFEDYETTPRNGYRRSSSGQPRRNRQNIDLHFEARPANRRRNDNYDDLSASPRRTTRPTNSNSRNQNAGRNQNGARRQNSVGNQDGYPPTTRNVISSTERVDENYGRSFNGNGGGNRNYVPQLAAAYGSNRRSTPTNMSRSSNSGRQRSSNNSYKNGDRGDEFVDYDYPMNNRRSEQRRNSPSISYDHMD